jgi:hypothetical protein
MSLSLGPFNPHGKKPMLPTLRFSFITALFCALAGEGAAAVEPFIGMAHVTRSDGVKLFILTGTYRDRARCEKLLPELVNKAIIDSPPKGMSAKIDYLVCDTKAPPRSEFAALRGEAPATRMIFFTENFRAMPVTPRTAAQDEQKACDYLRQRVLIRFGINGECIPPGR